MINQKRQRTTQVISRKFGLPTETYLRYIDAYCEWARDSGVRVHRHHANRRPDKEARSTENQKHHINFWSSFFESPIDHRSVEFECVSPFDHMFPAIQEIHSRTYWKRSTLCIRLMKSNPRKGPRIDLSTYCILNRDRGLPRVSSYRRRLDEPHSLPRYLDPFDEAFGSVPNHRAKMTPRLETVYEAVNPFDDRFPALVKVTNATDPTTTRKRRHRLSHKEKRTKMIQKKLRDYGRETILKKRQLKKAFRSIPMGLRFPSPGHKVIFLSVSPFDETFPNGARAKSITKKQRLHTWGTRKAAPAISESSQRQMSIQLPSPGMIPFPALTPVAAKSFARRGFFGDLSPRPYTNPIKHHQSTPFHTDSSLSHGLF